MVNVKKSCTFELNCCLGQMFVSDVSDFQFIGKVEPYFLSAGEEVLKTEVAIFITNLG